jgi:RND family efflux transporter MFP subunit
MRIWKQLLVGLAVAVAAVAVWIMYVPSAAPWLARAGVYDLLGISPPEPAAADDGRGFGGGSVQVVVAAAETGQVNARISAIGDGRAMRSVTVRSEATGLIREIAVEPGRYVEAGALVAELDAEAARIALERARLMVADATGTLERLERLRGSGAVSAAQLREAELALGTAELEVQQAEFDLRQRRIVAPISGWVGLLELDQGDRISAQDPIAVIADRSSLQIDFRVPERFIGGLSVGMPLEVTALARPGEVLEGEIVALDNAVDRASRTLRVQGQVDNADDSLRAGQAFAVALSFPGETLPSVDPLAIQWSGDGSFIWVAREGEAQRVPVVIRQRNADSVLVEGALEAGDLVVIEGVQSLRPGAAVEIVSDASATTGAAPGAAALRDI